MLRVLVEYGEPIPIASNATQTGRALKRRVEVRMIREDAPPAAPEELPIGVDRLREAIRQQVAESVASAMGEPDTTTFILHELHGNGGVDQSPESHHGIECT